MMENTVQTVQMYLNPLHINGFTLYGVKNLSQSTLYGKKVLYRVPCRLKALWHKGLRGLYGSVRCFDTHYILYVKKYFSQGKIHLRVRARIGYI